MKKLFIIPALLFALVSCDKEEEDVITTLNQKAEVKQQLQGEWSNDYKSILYYNDAGEVAFSDIDSLYLDVRHTFSGDNMHISHPGSNKKESFIYTVPDSSQTTYVVLSRNNANIDHYKILSMDEQSMVWEATVNWAGYRTVNSEGDSITVTSRKGVYTYRFKKL